MLYVSNLTGVRKTNAYACIEAVYHLSVIGKKKPQEIGPGILTLYCLKIKLMDDILILMVLNICFKY